MSVWCNEGTMWKVLFLACLASVVLIVSSNDSGQVSASASASVATKTSCCGGENVSCPLSCILNGCNCRDGFVYDPNVKGCVWPIKCTLACGQNNEVYSSCTNGGCDARNCSQLGQPVPCVKLDPKSCRKGCVCASEYLRASTGKCIPKDQCDKPQGCDNPNEEYDSCPATCPPQRCGVDPALVLCAPSPVPGDPECQPGCRCIDGYVRNVYDQCIPRDSCPKCNGQNEFFDTCISGCSNQTCDSIGKIYNCPIQPAVCRTGCRCEDDFYRNANNVCVPESECPKPAGCGGDPNAKPGCGVNCGRTCSTYKKGPVACPLYCKLDGCDCISGYVFDPAVSRCVLPADCAPQCGQNEIPSNCSNGGCGPFTCSDLGSPIKCVRPQKCEKGCVCENTYVRNDNGSCVPKNQCTGACGGDPNAQPGCGINCGRTCATYQSEQQFCPAICKENGCDCKKKFVFDDNLGKCVLPRDCTPKCGLNETYCPFAKRCHKHSGLKRILRGKGQKL